MHSPPRDRVAEVAHEGVDACQQSRDSRQEPNAHETTIIVYDNEDWTKDFRQFVRLSWRMQQEALGGGGHGHGARLSELLQLVVFHPQATHQTCEHSLHTISLARFLLQQFDHERGRARHCA